MIRCEEAAKIVWDYLDRELSDRDIRDLEEHVRACKKCVGHLEFDRALKGVLKKKDVGGRISEDVKDLIQKKLRQS